MTRIRSILAAADFSRNSRYAAERAAILGATLGVEKGLLLHVLEESWLESMKSFVSSPTDEMQRGIIDDASNSLLGLAEEIRQSSGFSFETRVLTGRTLNVIVEAALDHDLLVVGAHGRHPVLALALGTTAQRLLGKTRRSVLVVKSKPDRPYRRVLTAVDFSPNSRKAMEYGSIIAPGALVTVVHVYEPLLERQMISVGASEKVLEEYRAKARSHAETQMKVFLEAAERNTAELLQRIEYGHASARLPEIAQEWGPDLVIVGKHGRSRVEELLLGSVTIHLLSQSQCDVLVVQ
ncbi:MAG TPA: universal stress protein [Syntrophorhabdaceae bacterium]|nr:universal stress protein [Syntrophorhabdaceae bacterium]